MRRIALISLGCALAAVPAFADELKWQPAGQAPVATLGAPVAATLGSPVTAKQAPKPIIRASRRYAGARRSRAGRLSAGG